MPLASVSNLAAILRMGERPLRAQLNRLQQAGWLASMGVGMIERRQDRWFLTSQSAGALYVRPSQPDAAASLVDRMADVLQSPFADPSSSYPDAGAHEQLPWTATSRGVRISVRRLAALEMLYRLAPSLMFLGWLAVPQTGFTSRRDMRMTDFRLLRSSSWYHAVAHYGDDFWAAFTYVGLHSTERSLRRKRAHRSWGLDVYASDHDAYEIAADRTFYESAPHEATPSAYVILAADAWAAELAQREHARSTRPLICTPEGRWNNPVDVRPSGDRVWDPVTQTNVGRAERVDRWRRRNRGLLALCDPLGFATFMVIAQFPALREGELCRLVGEQPAPIHETIGRLEDVGLVVTFDGHCYLAEGGLRRAANLSRLLAAALIRRHGAYLSPDFRRGQLRHDIGVNRLVVQFADEGANVFAGWRGEINLPNVTQIKPDLVVQVSQGPFGSGAYCLEYERSATAPAEVIDKLRPYRRCAAVGSPVPLLMVCETERAASRFAEYHALLPLLVTHVADTETGRLTGDATVWNWGDAEEVSLHCRS